MFKTIIRIIHSFYLFLVRIFTTPKDPNENENNVVLFITAYDDPNLENIEKYLEISIKNIFTAVSTLVEQIHFNSDHPENHNLVIANIGTKTAKVFDGKNWTTMDEEELLNKLISTYEHLLNEYDSEYADKMKLLKMVDTPEKIYDNIKIEIKKVLYKKHNIMKRKKLN